MFPLWTEYRLFTCRAVNFVGKLSGKKMLVTGATGFVGGHLTRRLLRDGFDVSILVRSTSDRNIVEELERLGAKVYYGDVADRESVFKAIEGKDIVFHIAALFRQAKFPDEVYWDVNVRGTENVLDAAEEFGCERVVHCSTIGVHSHIVDPPADENEDYRPGDIYQVTKCEGEKLAKARFESGRVKGTIIRPAMIWGDGDRRLLKLFRGVAKRRFPIIGDGKTLTHWIYVHDLVQSFILAAEKDAAVGQTYIIAGKQPQTIEEVVDAVAEAAGVKPLPIKIPAAPVQALGSVVECVCKPLGIEPPIYRRRVDFFTKDRCFDTSKAESELGFQAANDFRTEVKKIYQWYNQAGWLN